MASGLASASGPAPGSAHGTASGTSRAAVVDRPPEDVVRFVTLLEQSPAVRAAVGARSADALAAGLAGRLARDPSGEPSPRQEQFPPGEEPMTGPTGPDPHTYAPPTAPGGPTDTAVLAGYATAPSDTDHHDPAQRPAGHSAPVGPADHRRPDRAGDHSAPVRPGAHRSPADTGGHFRPSGLGGHLGLAGVGEHPAPVGLCERCGAADTGGHFRPPGSGGDLGLAGAGEHPAPGGLCERCGAADAVGRPGPAACDGASGPAGLGAHVCGAEPGAGFRPPGEDGGADAFRAGVLGRVAARLAFWPGWVAAAALVVCAAAHFPLRREGAPLLVYVLALLASGLCGALAVALVVRAGVVVLVAGSVVPAVLAGLGYVEGRFAPRELAHALSITVAPPASAGLTAVCASLASLAALSLLLMVHIAERHPTPRPGD
ncbi:hypothetical protein GTY75_32130 [Streptomyces sp. SID8381]|uniref:hypothetical protein n=1 Tax=unclassified Streptomyces TaxID=2593676 RepID=UPI000482C613|nr:MULTISPECIES: hypothetical protein [unclassified Streptomyces]MYX31211.1 hypothetical protein [Streptomyces sp. SID8381]